MPSSTTLQAAVVVCFATTLRLVAGQQQCYYPDGSRSTTDTPCSSSAEVSACCKGSAYCLSNGLCMENGILRRESCTDKDWASGSCPQYCKNESISTGSPLMPCTERTFTCGLSPESCKTSSSLTFELKDANPIPSRLSQVTTISDATLLFTPTQLAGAGIGIALPLLAIIALLSWLYSRERRRNKAINLHNDQALYRSPVSPGVREINTCSWSAWSTDQYSRRGSVNNRGVLESIRELDPALQREVGHQSVRVF